MKKSMMKLIVIFAALSLSACAMNPFNSNKSSAGNSGTRLETATLSNSSEPVGGNIANDMDAADKSKLSRALDSAPGKVTTWNNPNTGITYTVIPTKKSASVEILSAVNMI